MPRVSVIMAVFNNQASIGRAIESIQQQTWSDWELIICDDHSGDQTYRVLLEYQKNDPRITVLQNLQNQGPAYSRNLCIASSRGEYIAVLDGDDYAHPERFRRQVEFLDQHPEAAFVGSNVWLYDEQGVWGERRFKSAPQPEDFLKRVHFCHPSIIYRKEALLEVDCFRVAPETRRGQDADLYTRLYGRGRRGYNLPDFLVYYYEGQQSFTRIPFRHRLNSVLLRYQGYKAMGLLPRGLLHIWRPLLIGIIPKRLLWRYKRHRYGSAVGSPRNTATEKKG